MTFETKDIVWFAVISTFSTVVIATTGKRKNKPHAWRNAAVTSILVTGAFVTLNVANRPYAQARAAARQADMQRQYDEGVAMFSKPLPATTPIPATK